MTRVTATIGTDLRLQYRNGFYVATFVVMLASFIVLHWLPRDSAVFLLPAVIIGNVLVNTFYFAGGLLLLERVEGTLLAQCVTPLRADEYLFGKVITLTVLSLAESLLVVSAVFGIVTGLLAMAIGISLSAILFCLVGIAVVVRYDSINQFLLPSVLCAFVLNLPVLELFGAGSEAWYLPHPITGPLSLMQIDESRSAGSFAYAILYPLVWIVPAYLWSRRALLAARTA